MNEQLRHRAICVIAGLLLAVGLAGCGRSAPESAADDTSTDGPEPASAGIRVVSEQTVVPPAPTTVPTITTVAPTTTVPAAAPAGTYVVEAGDTLSVIAERFGVTIDALSEANGITDVNSIRPGQELIIPATG